VGPNGSGKTTLLRLLSRELSPAAGEIRTADALQIVYFDQNRIDPSGLQLSLPVYPSTQVISPRSYRDANPARLNMSSLSG
jgi:ATPase subunit of ABC transporter with duplicated ATPase domains